MLPLQRKRKRGHLFTFVISCAAIVIYMSIVHWEHSRNVLSRVVGPWGLHHHLVDYGFFIEYEPFNSSLDEGSIEEGESTQEESSEATRDEDGSMVEVKDMPSLQEDEYDDPAKGDAQEGLLAPLDSEEKPTSLLGNAGEQAPRYIHLLSTVEGVAGWTVAVREIMYLAVTLNRVLVEPCVRNGRIMPCWPHKVVGVPDGHDDTELAALTNSGSADPLALPRYIDECRTTNSSYAERVLTKAHGRTFPLRAYINLRALAEELPALKMITFDQWVGESIAATEKQAKLKSAADEAAGFPVGESTDDSKLPYQAAAPGSHISMRRVVCVSELFPCKRKGQVIGPYRFAKATNAGLLAQAASKDIQWQLGRLNKRVWAAQRDIFCARWFRGSWKAAGLDLQHAPLPPFNPLHYLAVKSWLSQQGFPAKGGLSASSKKDAKSVSSLIDDGWIWKYGVVQWRTERVPDGRLSMCTGRLIESLRAVFKRLPPGRALNASAPHFSDAIRAGGKARDVWPAKRHAGGILVADIASPATPCSLWGDYRSGTSAIHQAALARLSERFGLLKYDADYPLLDPGVLAIRDAILAMRATWYFTCAGRGGDRSAICRSCSWPSRYVSAITAVRKRAGLQSNEDMFRLSGQLQAVRPPLPPAAAAGHGGGGGGGGGGGSSRRHRQGS